MEEEAQAGRWEARGWVLGRDLGSHKATSRSVPHHPLAPGSMWQAQPSVSSWAAGRGLRTVPWVSAPGIWGPRLLLLTGRALGKRAGPPQAPVEDMASADEGC